MRKTFEQRWGHSNKRTPTHPRRTQRRLAAKARQAAFETMTPSELAEHYAKKAALFPKK